MSSEPFTAKSHMENINTIEYELDEFVHIFSKVSEDGNALVCPCGVRKEVLNVDF